MRAKAVLMALAMMTTAVAGCTGTDGVTEVDEDALNELIDANLQDFINNTTVVVNQDFHYHNNTTVVNNHYDTTNEYNNTTNVDGGEVNNYVTDNSNYGHASGGNGSSSQLLFYVDIEWDAIDMYPQYGVPGDRNNTFSYSWTYWDYATNQERTDVFEFSCSEYYIFETVSANNNTYSWGTYWESSEPYYDAWDNEYNDTIADLLQNYAWYEDLRSVCDDDYSPSGYIAGHHQGHYSFLNITIPEGYAIAYRQENFFVWQGSTLVTDDYYYYDVSESHYNGHPRNANAFYENYLWVYGGWDDITVEFVMYGGSGTNQYIYPHTSYRYTLYYELIPVMPHS